MMDLVQILAAFSALSGPGAVAVSVVAVCIAAVLVIILVLMYMCLELFTNSFSPETKPREEP